MEKFLLSLVTEMQYTILGLAYISEFTFYSLNLSNHLKPLQNSRNHDALLLGTADFLQRRQQTQTESAQW